MLAARWKLLSGCRLSGFASPQDFEANCAGTSWYKGHYSALFESAATSATDTRRPGTSAGGEADPETIETLERAEAASGRKRNFSNIHAWLAFRRYAATRSGLEGTAYRADAQLLLAPARAAGPDLAFWPLTSSSPGPPGFSFFHAEGQPPQRPSQPYWEPPRVCG
jgi:hypothetical protein